MDKRQNLRRRETTAEKPQEGGAVQPGSGSEGAQAQKTVGGGEGKRDERVGGSHCAGTGALWRGGAIGQLRRSRLWVGPSFERRGLDELPQRRQAQREAGSGGAT